MFQTSTTLPVFRIQANSHKYIILPVNYGFESFPYADSINVWFEWGKKKHLENLKRSQHRKEILWEQDKFLIRPNSGNYLSKFSAEYVNTFFYLGVDY